MNRIRLMNCASYVAIFAGYLITGWITFVIPMCFKAIFANELPGKPLPELTGWVLAYGTSGASIAVNLILGLIFVGLLFFLEFGDEKRKPLIPICLTLAFVLNFLQLTSVLEGVSMPYFFVTLGLSDGNH